MYIYIYIYVYTERERDVRWLQSARIPRAAPAPRAGPCRKRPARTAHVPVNTRWLPDGVRTDGFFAEVPQITCLFAMFCLGAHILPQVPYLLPHFAMKVAHGKSRHFCDDPVCPDPCGSCQIRS